MTKKPKIDINSLRIEIQEDDLNQNYHNRTYYMFEYCLRDDDRVFKVGPLDEVLNFLSEKFRCDFKNYLNPRLRNWPATIYLKDDLTKYLTESVYTAKRGYELAEFNKNN